MEVEVTLISMQAALWRIKPKWFWGIVGPIHFSQSSQLTSVLELNGDRTISNAKKKFNHCCADASFTMLAYVKSFLAPMHHVRMQLHHTTRNGFKAWRSSWGPGHN